MLKKILDIVAIPVYLCIIFALVIAAPILAGYHPVVVLSGSMEPNYPVGSVTYYKAAAFNEIAEGDAITFRAGESSLVTHRVVEKSETGRSFATKGDANNTIDPNEVTYDQVVGKAVNICIPYAGYLVSIGKQPVFIAVCALILVAGMIADKTTAKKAGSKGQAG